MAKTQVYSFFQALLSVIISVCYVPLVIVEIVFTSYLAGAYIVLPGLIGANVIAGVFIGLVIVSYTVVAVYRYIKLMFARNSNREIVIPT